MPLPPIRGHVEARKALARARRTDSIPSALLVHGAPGVGKQRLALWVGQAVLCREMDGDDPCGRCKDCRLVLRLEHPDLHWFFPLPRPSGSHSPDKLAELLEDARGAALAERREAGRWDTYTEEVAGLYLAMARTIRKKAQRRPAMSDRQMFIIAEAEELVPQASSPEAANSLLKLLEEPPEGTSFILTSSRPGSLLPTIRSRCFPLHLPALTTSEVRDHLVEVLDADPDEAERAARLGQGAIGRAVAYLPESEDEKGVLESMRRSSFKLLRAGLSLRAVDGFSLANDYKPSGARGVADHFTYLEEWIRDLAAAASGQSDRILNQDARDYLDRVARERNIHPVAAANALRPVAEARMMTSGNVNPQLIVARLIQELRQTLIGEGTRGRGPGSPGAHEAEAR